VLDVKLSSGHSAGDISATPRLIPATREFRQELARFIQKVTGIGSLLGSRDLLRLRAGTVAVKFDLLSISQDGYK
jgi:hypothetical protein